jgi:hypothetical protein
MVKGIGVLLLETSVMVVVGSVCKEFHDRFWTSPPSTLRVGVVFCTTSLTYTKVF